MRVGFVGPMMVGKSTVAKSLVKRYGFVNIALADALKQDCTWMLNSLIDVIDFHHPTILRRENHYVTREMIDRDKPIFRPLLQWLGTDFWRQYMRYPEFWLDRLADSVEEALLMYPEQSITTDDVRFLNEAAYLRHIGYTIVRVERPEEERLAMLRKAYPDPAVLEEILSHPSETESRQIKPDFVIQNNGSLWDLDVVIDTQLFPFLRGREKQ